MSFKTFQLGQRSLRTLCAGGVVASAVVSFGQSETSESTSSQITDQQKQVMEHLEALYKRDGREMPSLKMRDAPNTYIPNATIRPKEPVAVRSEATLADDEAVDVVPNDVVPTAGSEDEAPQQRGFFSRFRNDSSGGESKRVPFFSRFRPSENDVKSDSKSEASESDRQNFLERIPNPFRSSESNFLESEPKTPVSSEDESDLMEATPGVRSPDNFVPPAPKAIGESHRTAALPHETRYRDTGVALERPGKNPFAESPSSPPAMLDLNSTDMESSADEMAPELGAPDRLDEHQTDAENPFGDIGESESVALEVPNPFADVPKMDVNPDIDDEPATFEAVDPEREQRRTTLEQKLAERSSQTGMQGFCPVVLRNEKRLVDAQADLTCEYEGRTYAVSSERAQELFNGDPTRYAPVESGNDVVLLHENAQPVEGLLTHASWYDEKLFLFRSADTAAKFNESPELYWP